MRRAALPNHNHKPLADQAQWSTATTEQRDAVDGATGTELCRRIGDVDNVREPDREPCDQVGFWLSPPELMEPLQREFAFTFDACPYPRPEGFDGLMLPWGARTYCNPPFRGGVMKWARKAVLEHMAGKLVVLLLPHRAIQWCTEPLLDAGAETRILRPVNWLNP